MALKAKVVAASKVRTRGMLPTILALALTLSLTLALALGLALASIL